MIIRTRCAWSVGLALAGFSSAALASRQTAALETATRVPDVRILSPVDGALVNGPTRLRAAVDPPDLVSSVEFFLDGRLVCSAAPPRFECDWNAGSAIVPHQVRAVANLVDGGRLVRTARTKGIGFAETVDVNVVQVTVTVMDKDGRFVKGLPKSAFRVSEDGRPQAVSHFYSGNAPLELVAAVDVSGSMGSAMPTVKKAVSSFLGAVPARDRVTLLGFNDEVFTLTRSTTDPAARMRAVGGLTSWGSTVFYDAIVHGAEILELHTGRKALVVFTDGEDQASHVTLAEVEARLQASDLALYLIGQGRAVTSAPLKKLLERLSRPTGGRAFFTNRIDDLYKSFTEVLDELSNQYVLGYQPLNTARDDTWRRITVDVDGHDRVRARQGYRPTPRR